MTDSCELETSMCVCVCVCIIRLLMSLNSEVSNYWSLPLRTGTCWQVGWRRSSHKGGWCSLGSAVDGERERELTSGKRESHELHHTP